MPHVVLVAEGDERSLDGDKGETAFKITIEAEAMRRPEDAKPRIVV